VLRPDPRLRATVDAGARLFHVVFSLDGQTLATSAQNGAIQLWKVADGTPVRVLRGHTTDAALAFSPDGIHLVSAGWDGTIRLWDLTKGALISSTFLGGSANESGLGIAVDSSGNAYLTGSTFSTNFPTTASAAQTSCSTSCTAGDAFLTKLNASGSALAYSTFLGGTSADTGWGVAVDSSGNAYVTGSASSGFPTTASAYASSGGGVFLTKINPSLSGAASLLYSSFLGLGVGNDIALDSANAAYVTGETTTATFPTKNAVQSSCGGSSCDSAFVAKFNPSLSGANSLVYSTFLGGSSVDAGQAIAVDASGSATIVGETASTDLITTTGALQPRCGGSSCDDAFVTRLNAAGSARLSSTYLGGSDVDAAYAVALDASGNAFLTGFTFSNDFPQRDAQQPSYGGTTDAFVTALRADGTGLLSSTYLGGSGGDDAWGLALDSRGSVVVTGQTESSTFPRAFPAQQTYGGGDDDAFVTRFTPPARVTTYTYDGLLRLIRAASSSGNTYVYTYDDAGNRTSVQVNGGTPATLTYNAADRITTAGYSYDTAGNLLTDGTATYTYDALNRTKTVAGAQSRTYTYNGDGVLVKQVAGSTRITYTQDLATPLSQVLQTKVGATTTSYLYGLERLASRSGTPRTWYLADALGSVRRTLNDGGAANLPIFYDPWGTPESGTVPTFGFTGELQDTAAGLVNLRARWYSTARGTFTAYRWRADESFDDIPYSHHPYQYAYSNPVLHTDPSGKIVPGVCPIGYRAVYKDGQFAGCEDDPNFPAWLWFLKGSFGPLPVGGVAAGGTLPQVGGQAAGKALEVCATFAAYLLGQLTQTNTQANTQPRQSQRNVVELGPGILPENLIALLGRYPDAKIHGVELENYKVKGLELVLGQIGLLGRIEIIGDNYATYVGPLQHNADVVVSVMPSPGAPIVLGIQNFIKPGGEVLVITEFNSIKNEVIGAAGGKAKLRTLVPKDTQGVFTDVQVVQSSLGVPLVSQFTGGHRPWEIYVPSW
jgi:RHS repeat-associated protein